jgi:hypothetical protein
LRNSEFKTFEKKDFPGETFHIVKEKDDKQFSEYRACRMALEAWDRLSKKPDTSKLFVRSPSSDWPEEEKM